MLRRPTFEPLFTTHPSEVGSTSPWTLLAAMLLDTRCRTLARRMVPRSWSVYVYVYVYVRVYVYVYVYVSVYVYMYVSVYVYRVLHRIGTFF